MPDLKFASDIAIALLLGMIIGVERQWSGHIAGTRTNALVALGAAMFVGLSALYEKDPSPIRIAGQVVTGLGFLGGGVILREGFNIRGLNTAATIWCSGAIGTLAGARQPYEAFLGAVAVLFINVALRPLALYLELREKTLVNIETNYQLRLECDVSNNSNVRNILLRHVADHKSLSLQGVAAEETSSGRMSIRADIFSVKRDDRALEDIVARLSIEPDVKAVSWKRTTA